jgi:DNA repair exonuclease SbcCD ATPase subunit
VNKKILILAIALALVSFAGSFLVAFLTGNKTPVETQPIQNQDTDGQLAATIQQGQPSNLSPNAPNPATTLALTERHLKNLIQDIREKINEYKNKLNSLELREERIKTTQQQLQRDIDELAALRTEAASMVASLKQERERLLKTRIAIEQSEKDNLMLIAATYDKMNATSAGEIFTNMSKINEPGASGLLDVVKIMYYMNERNKAKVLAELVNTEPKLAAVLSQELKRIKEVTQ